MIFLNISDGFSEISETMKAMTVIKWICTAKCPSDGTLGLDSRSVTTWLWHVIVPHHSQGSQVTQVTSSYLSVDAGL